VILATVKIEDLDRFLGTFTTKGAEKRRQLGSKGARVFRDPSDTARLWLLFDWDEEGYGKYLADPDLPAIGQEAGLQGPPEKAELVREHEA
jgi:hypothetical protein